MRSLAIDIETYSSTDLINCGVYKYVEADDFEVLLFAWAYDDEEVQCVDLANFEAIPQYVLDDLVNEHVQKTAFNANFERVCLTKALDIYLDPLQWECTMVRSAMLGLPMSLAAVGKALELDDDEVKMKQGKALIQYFSKPCKPTRVNGQRGRNFPYHDEDRWGLFVEYCKQDVVTERAIRKKLDLMSPMPEEEHLLWSLDQRMNDSGILLDLDMIDGILKYDELNKYDLMEEATRISGLDNPNSVAQLKKWFYEHEGIQITSLAKNKVLDLLNSDISDEAKRLLIIRQQMSKTSISKYQKMHDSVCSDGRIRGILQFYGASRTGRWAGRLVQVHNLPQNKYKEIDFARELVKEDDYATVEMLFSSSSNVLSQLIRTSFIAKNEFVIVDFSAIEARVIAWYADERWRNEVFASHGKIYEASASQMFKVPLDRITSELRSKGKVAELALGYQGGVGALKQMGALEMGLSGEELPVLVSQWRASNRKIVAFWNEIGNLAIECIHSREPQRGPKGLKFYMKGKTLFIQLPSGRALAYYGATLVEGTYGKQIEYSGMDQTKKIWTKQNTYGGKLVENIVQATARDCLAVCLMRCDDAGYDMKFHVHDEIIVDTDSAESALKDLLEIMAQPIEWATNLQLKGDGFISRYYMKD